MPLKQATRLLNLKTPLGENTLLLTGFRGVEGLSQLFRFEIDMISDDNAIAATYHVKKKNSKEFVTVKDAAVLRCRIEPGIAEVGRHSRPTGLAPDFVMGARA